VTCGEFYGQSRATEPALAACRPRAGAAGLLLTVYACNPAAPNDRQVSTGAAVAAR
jgi:hypothetical protein